MPCYWKNSALNPLQISSGYFGQATGIALDSLQNLYCAGWVQNTASGPTVPCYWDNGTLSLLPMGSPYASGMATGIAFDSKGNLYITGEVQASATLPMLPCFWAGIPANHGHYLESKLKRLVSGMGAQTAAKMIKLILARATPPA